MSSLRNVLRSRFRSDKSPNAGPRVAALDVDKRESSDSEDEEDEPESREGSHEADDKKVLELRMSQLQQQLVAAMIENHTLGAELQTWKEGIAAQDIQDQLDIEKRKNKVLEEHLIIAQKSQSRPIYVQEIANSDWVDVAHECQEEKPAIITGITHKRSILDRLSSWFLSEFYELVADFTEDAEPVEDSVKEGDQLAVKKLKDNIKRFKRDIKPIVGTAKGVRGIFTWYNPALTFTIFMIYMYSVWYGWLLPVVLFFVLTKLSINYLKKRGLNINIVLLADVEDEERDSETFRDLGMSAKFDLVVQVAKQVQNFLGKVADNLEKLKNLLLWEQVEATRRLYVLLWVLFILSIALPGPTLFTILALFLGFKMFVLQYIHTKFPRFKQRHDSTQRLWRKLPTDVQLREHYQQAAITQNILPDTNESLRRSSSSNSGSRRSLSEKETRFSELFQLPSSENPLEDWKRGRRCILIDRDKWLKSALKSGKLYLTHSFLCFEKHKSLAHAHLNLMVPLADITNIEKGKTLSWMPGQGMTIEVYVTNQSKPYLFGAIINRDEVFESILTHAQSLQLPWALEHQTIPTPVTTPTLPSDGEQSDENNESLTTDPDPDACATENDSTPEPTTADAQNLFL